MALAKLYMFYMCDSYEMIIYFTAGTSKKGKGGSKKSSNKFQEKASEIMNQNGQNDFGTVVNQAQQQAAQQEGQPTYGVRVFYFLKRLFL